MSKGRLGTESKRHVARGGEGSRGLTAETIRNVSAPRSALRGGVRGKAYSQPRIYNDLLSKFSAGQGGQGPHLLPLQPEPVRRDPGAVLGGTKGFLISDGYTGYNKVTIAEGRERVRCIAHLRPLVGTSSTRSRALRRRKTRSTSSSRCTRSSSSRPR